MFVPLLPGDGDKCVVVLACKSCARIIIFSSGGEPGKLRITGSSFMHQPGRLDFFSLLLLELRGLLGLSKGASGPVPETFHFLEVRVVGVLKMSAAMRLQSFIGGVNVATQQ